METWHPERITMLLRCKAFEGIVGETVVIEGELIQTSTNHDPAPIYLSIYDHTLEHLVKVSGRVTIRLELFDPEDNNGK